MVRFSRLRTAFIKDVSPEAPSEWPRFAFTDPMYTPFSPKTRAMALASIGSPTGVPVPWHST
ncbi:hypothetical protein I7I48_00621 [Histoplasma ohiense]|nr:hypothetical protein I7I48_00621 [Histoplasma ohiense (nom. inval.)]